MMIPLGKVSLKVLQEMAERRGLSKYTGPTKGFEFAPQRENYESDEAFEDACKLYLIDVLVEQDDKQP